MESCRVLNQWPLIVFHFPFVASRLWVEEEEEEEEC